MGLIKNKRGQFFTLIAIIVISIFLLSYIIYNIEHQNRKSIHNRIDSMNNFVFSLKEDFRRQIYITGFRIIYLYEDKIGSTGSPINNLNSSFEEAFKNGTINGEYQDLLNGIKLGDIVSSLSAKANENNLNLTIGVHNLTITQQDPWHVKINILTDILIQDKNNLASWNNTETISAEISITNFEDPLYIINTNGLVANKINKSEYVFKEDDLTNLSLQYQNSLYIASPTAPSFLDRLQNKTTANQNGIESLVYLPKLSAQGISLKDRSVVDYIYFSNDIPSHNIQGMPIPWFRLDDAHLGVYNVTGKVI
jgi:hypothetical protein